MDKIYENWQEHVEDLDDDAVRSILQEQSVSDLYSVWQDIRDEQKTRLFRLMEIEQKVYLISEVSPGDQEDLLKTLSKEGLGRLLEVMPPDDLVDLIQQLPDEVRLNVWDQLSTEDRREMKFLLRFDEDDAAGLMTPRYAAIRSNLTVGQALDFVRQNLGEAETVYYIYVVDELKRLHGVVSLKDLLIAGDNDKIEAIMETNVVHVYDTTDQEDTARVIEDYDLIAVPVVDRFDRLLGIVTFDDIIDVIREEQTEDVYKMGAMAGTPDSYMDSSIFSLVKKRVPWIIILLLAGTITTNVLYHYEGIIMGAAFLSLFIPVITQTGGNSGAQSSTLMIRGLATGEVRFRDLGKVMFKECLVGLLIGITTGVIIIIRSRFLPPGIGTFQALTIGAALSLVVLFASVLGALVPLILDKIGIDPTVASGPLMSTIIDVCGLTIYFEVARLILGVG